MSCTATDITENDHQDQRAAALIVDAAGLEPAPVRPHYNRIAEAIITALSEDRLPEVMIFPSNTGLRERLDVAPTTLHGVRRYLHDRGHLETHNGVQYLTRDTSCRAVRREIRG